LSQQQLHCSCSCDCFLVLRALHGKVAELARCMLLLLCAAGILQLLQEGSDLYFVHLVAALQSGYAMWRGH
jgi:hypothetical protein